MKKTFFRKPKGRHPIYRIHERITYKSDYFVQKVSLDLVKPYDLISFEDPNIKGMVKNSRLAKHIADAASNKLITTTSYQENWPVNVFELLNPTNTC